MAISDSACQNECDDLVKADLITRGKYTTASELASLLSHTLGRRLQSESSNGATHMAVSHVMKSDVSQLCTNGMQLGGDQDACICQNPPPPPPPRYGPHVDWNKCPSLSGDITANSGYTLIGLFIDGTNKRAYRAIPSDMSIIHMTNKNRIAPMYLDNPSPSIYNIQSTRNCNNGAPNNQQSMRQGCVCDQFDVILKKSYGGFSEYACYNGGPTEGIRLIADSTCSNLQIFTVELATGILVMGISCSKVSTPTCDSLNVVENDVKTCVGACMPSSWMLIPPYSVSAGTGPFQCTVAGSKSDNNYDTDKTNPINVCPTDSKWSYENAKAYCMSRPT